MEYNRDFKGVWIPREIWENDELSMIDKGIFTEINSLDNENHCYASNEYFANFCKVSVPTVTRSIKKLKDLGLIEEMPSDGRHRILRVINLITQTNQFDYPASSICVSNNIYNNTSNKEEILLSNKLDNNTENPNYDDFESKMYSPDDYKPVKTNKKRGKPRKSLYSKCEDEIQLFSNNMALQNALLDYLKIRLAIKDKPIVGVSQWKALLNKLADLTADTGEQIKIVNKSAEMGWASFYPFNSKTTKVFSEPEEMNVTQAKKLGREQKFVEGIEF